MRASRQFRSSPAPALAFAAVLLLLAAPAPAATGPSSSSGALSGAVVDPDGRPVPAARVRVETPAGVAAIVSTSASGLFDVPDLAPGAYIVRVVHPGFVAEPIALRLGAGEHPHIAVSLRLAAYDDTIVVSAAQVEAPVSATPTSVTVFTSRDLERRQFASASEALRLTPGMSVAQNGSRGALTSVFPRGGESDFTLVLVDGVRVNAFGGGFDFSFLPAAGIERLEVVRGPQSALYGADAIGGIVQVITQRDGPTRVAGTLEGGSFDTTRGTLSTSGSAGAWHWGASAERSVSDGFTGLAPGTGERVSNDDFAGSAATASLRYARPAWTVSGFGRLARTEKGFPGPFGSDPNGTYPGVDRVSRGRNEDVTGGLQATFTASPRFRLSGSASVADLDGRFVSSFGESLSETRRLSGRAQVDWAAGEAFGLSAGAEVLHERARSTYITDLADTVVPVRRRMTGVFGEGRFELPNKVTIAAGLRVEHIRRDALEGNGSGFAPRPSFDADSVVSVNPRAAFGWFVRGAAPGALSWTRLRLNAGTGIRAPDAFEIAFTDNPRLKPERSLSLEGGLEQAFFDARAVVEATAFFNRYDDLIVAVGPAFPDASRYLTDNIANARSRGLELAVHLRPRAWLETRAGYTLLETEVLSVDGSSGQAPFPFEPGDPLIRRPRHHGWAEVLASSHGVSAFARLGARGRVTDVDPTYGAFGGQLEAPGYTVVDIGASATLWREIAVFGRLTNLFDRAYEEALGFPSPGRAFVGGVRVAAGR